MNGGEMGNGEWEMGNEWPGRQLWRPYGYTNLSYSYSLLPIPYSLLPIPYCLFPIPH